MSNRRRLTRKQRADLFDREHGICVHCHEPIDARKEPWHVAHIIALALGGPDTLANMGPAHDRCNMEDAYKEVAPKAAKANRIRARERGIRKPSTFRDGHLKKRMNGTVIDKRTGEQVWPREKRT